MSAIQAIALRAQAAQQTADAEAAKQVSARASKSVGGKKDPATQFESFVMQSFLQEMLPKDTDSVFGGGLAGEYWRSMMAEKLGDVMAQSGSIGIADIVRKSVKLKEAALQSPLAASAQAASQVAGGALLSDTTASAIAALSGSASDGE